MNATHRRSYWIGLCGGCCLMNFVVGVTFVSPAVAQNVGVRLTDGTDVFDYTAGGNSSLPVGTNGAGTAGNVPMNFQLAGAPGDPAHQQIVSGNWFYRIAGDTQERHLEGADARNLSGTDYVRYRFDEVYTGGSNPVIATGWWAEMDWKITDTGPNSALCETEVCFHNDSDTPIEMDVFLAIDFNLNADAANDAIANLIGGNMWRITDGLWTGLMYGPAAIGADAGVASTLMGQMTNSSINNYVPPLVSGGTFSDGATLLQFRRMVAGHTMFCPGVRLAIGIGVEPPLFVPEPASMALLGLGAAGMCVCQRGPRRRR